MVTQIRLYVPQSALFLNHLLKLTIMLIEIQSLDNGSGVNSNLDVYLSYNEPRKLFELRPYCRIDENDLCDLLTDSQIEKLVTGTIHFRINKNQLADKANKIY